tara:strand:+ start:462 stop:1103 length:642 start_codon:yes stop_codon:yes gene_type:complete
MIERAAYLVGVFSLFFLCSLAYSSDTIQCVMQPDKSCTLVLKEGAQPWLIYFNVSYVSDDEYVIKHITLIPPGDYQTCHTLEISDMAPVFKEDTVLLYAQDINHDGFRDIWFVTDKGVANTYAVYWLYDSGQNKFVLLDKYPWLMLNTDQQTLQSFERHGHGGRIYTKNLYRFENQTLILIEQEKQFWDSNNNQYIKKIIKEPLIYSEPSTRF